MLLYPNGNSLDAEFVDGKIQGHGVFRFVQIFIFSWWPTFNLHSFLTPFLGSKCRVLSCQGYSRGSDLGKPLFSCRICIVALSASPMAGLSHARVSFRTRVWSRTLRALFPPIASLCPTPLSATYLPLCFAFLSGRRGAQLLFIYILGFLAKLPQGPTGTLWTKATLETYGCFGQ